MQKNCTKIAPQVKSLHKTPIEIALLGHVAGIFIGIRIGMIVALKSIGIAKGKLKLRGKPNGI